MAKLLKKWMAEELNRELEGVDSFILFAFGSADAEQTRAFRKSMFEQNVNVRVLKNTIAEKVFSQQYNLDMSDMLNGPVAMAHSKESIVEVAKALGDWKKKFKKFELKGGYLDGKIIDSAQVDALAKIPPREVLLSMLAGTIQSPIQQVATLVSASAQSVSYALGGLIDKLEKESDN